jgi:quercetin dioxygenase-like cupin family protein
MAALSFLGRPLPPSFELRVITIEPGGERAYDDADWRDALVVIERGAVELEGLSGRRYACRRGDVVWLERLPLRVLRNRGRVAAVLAAVSRVRSDEFSADGQSEV